MADPTAFTRKANREISRYLENRQFRESILISTMYAETRLATLIWRSLGIDNPTGRESFDELFKNETAGQMATLCFRGRMITSGEKGNLQKLFQLRNVVAHDFEIWENLDERIEEAIEHWCRYVIEFMRMTDDRRIPIRAESPQQEPDYLRF